MARLRTFDDNRNGWLITFADLVTLLLALFVLIFSMTSLDSAIIKSISSSISREMPKRDLNRGEITENIREVAQLITAGEAHQHAGRIIELLFPRDLLPPFVDKGTLDTSLRVVDSGQGVAFVMDDSLLFESGSSRVSETGRAILSSMASLVEVVDYDINISAYYAGLVMEDLPDDYAVAGRHALAALGVFINQGSDKGRFSVSAYGADRAIDDLKLGAPHSRVEILFKNGAAVESSKEIEVALPPQTPPAGE